MYVLHYEDCRLVRNLMLTCRRSSEHCWTVYCTFDLVFWYFFETTATTNDHDKVSMHLNYCASTKFLLSLEHAQFDIPPVKSRRWPPPVAQINAHVCIVLLLLCYCLLCVKIGSIFPNVNFNLSCSALLYVRLHKECRWS